MKRIIFALIGTILLLTGCKKMLSVEVNNASVGKDGEIVLIMDTSVWATAIQDSVKHLLSIPQPGINQIEPMFDIQQIMPNEFNGDIMRHHAILQFDISENNSKTELLIQNNTWATPQIYIKIKGNNQDSCFSYFINNQEDIIQHLYNNDINRIQGNHSDKTNKELEKLIQTKFGISLTIPKNYEKAREGDDFLWIAYRTKKNDRFIMIYKSDSTNLTRSSIINNRNRITRQYIEGATSEDIHPIVAEISNLPLAQPLKIGINIGMELRGLWETENDNMGGPFYHFSFVNRDNKCISIDGFVYAPTENKRNYLRQVEAIVKTVK